MKVMTYISKRGHILNASLEKVTDAQEEVDFDGMAYKMYEALKPEAAFEEFSMGLKEEFEHEDVTGGDLGLTGKIVMAHLKEDAKYYSKLKAAIAKGGPGSGRYPEGSGKEEGMGMGDYSKQSEYKLTDEEKEKYKEFASRESKAETDKKVNAPKSGFPLDAYDRLNNMNGATYVESEGDNSLRVDFENGGSVWFESHPEEGNSVRGNAGEYNSEVKRLATKWGAELHLDE